MRLAAAAVWVVLPIMAGSGLYLVKMRVEAQDQRLTQLQRQIVEAKESIRVLNAEWSYLNDPVRLRDQAERLLSMKPVKPSQIVSFDQIPYPDPAPASPSTDAAPKPLGPLASAAPVKTPVKALGPIAQADRKADPLAAVIAGLAEADRADANRRKQQ